MNTEKKNWKLVNFCEVDTYAVKSYCAIHNVDENLNLGDVAKVDEKNIEPFNMIVGGSPCQDFSAVGNKRGSVWTCKDCGEEYNPLTVHFSERDKCPHCGSRNLDKSRSSLLVEWLRIIRANKPNFGMYENVKNIVGKQFKETTFKLFTDELEEYGYNVYWKVLNAKDYGIPQNRERVYLILIKKELDNGKFKYPKDFNNIRKLKEFIDTEVDPKYKVNTPRTQAVISCLTHTDGVGDKRVGKIKYNHTSFPCIFDDRDIGSSENVGFCIQTSDICPTQRAGRSGIKVIVKNGESYSIRKLTPKECFRLSGFSDNNFVAVKGVVSDTQLYKQVGNSIVVDVLYYILVELYKAMPYLFDDLKLCSYFSGIGAFEVALNRLYSSINNMEICQ